MSEDSGMANRELTEKKKELRRKVLKLRKELSEEERKKAALLLTERLAGHQWFYSAEYFLGFVGYGSEIDTRGILQEALDRGKKVYVPRVEGEEMVFYRIRSLEELLSGYKGIPEPAGDTEVFRYEEFWTEEDAVTGNGLRQYGSSHKLQHVLMLMPGVAFDLYHNRMGYGKGFYDRFLSSKEALRLRTVGVGFRCQLVEEVPAEEHDVKPYQVICV